MNNNRYSFDVEVFKNFFCVTFIKVDTKEIKTFIIWKNRDDRKELLEFLSNNLFLISFNGLSYDLPILRFIKNYSGQNINSDLYKLSTKLVSEEHRRDGDIIELRYPHYEEPFVHQDLMSMMNFVRTGVGLKQCSINLKWHKVQDSPFDFNHTVIKKDIDIIVDYNINDVLITLELYNDTRVKEARELREAIVDTFGAEILSAAKSKMANIFFEKRYEEETGISKREFKELRTPRTSINISDVIFPNINFKTEKFNNLLQELKDITVFGYDEYKFSKSVFYNSNEYVMGIGGLHTSEKPALYRQTKTHEILSMDVSSFYPAIMCEYNIKPEHLQDEFLDILREIKEERIKAKKSKNKMKAETYKILLNATFGKLGFDSYWMYDPLALVRVTLNGQLFLLMLIEKMEENGIRCISGNTDGCEFIVPIELKHKAYLLAKEWEKETKFELEYVNYSLMAKRDVNAYLAVDTEGKKKAKGYFAEVVELEKGYLHPIVGRAINNYFINNVLPEETIYKCEDIMEFCISKKSGSDFAMELHTLKGIENLQKTNRFYISNSGGTLQKRNKKTGKLIGLFVGRVVKILNNYDSATPFKDYDVNKTWYIRDARSLIDKIEPSVIQEAMFDGGLDYGKRLNLLGEEVKKKKHLSVPKIISEKEIREANKRKLTYDVNSKYALVTNIDVRFSPKISFYSLSKGTENKFKIKKDLYAKNPLKYGDVVCLEEFKKRPRYTKDGDKFIEVQGQFEWWVGSYQVIEDFSGFKRKTYA